MKLSCVDATVPGTTLKEKFKNLRRYGFKEIESWVGGGSSEIEKEIR